jgi:hypothetical protein
MADAGFEDLTVGLDKSVEVMKDEGQALSGIIDCRELSAWANAPRCRQPHADRPFGPRHIVGLKRWKRRTGTPCNARTLGTKGC